MPNPLRRPPRHLNFDSNAVAKNPIAPRLAAAINEWSKTEGALGILLGVILQNRYAAATEMLSSVVNLSARLDLVKGAVKATHPLWADKVHTKMDEFRVRAGERNDLVHGTWGVSEDHPNKLVFCEPSAAFRVIAGHYDSPTRDDLELIEKLTPHLRLWGSKCFLASQHRFAELQKTTIDLSNAIQADPAA